MRNRLSALSKHAPRALCVLALCGLMWSCKDDYVLDDEKPGWLKSSIYSYLDERGEFETYLRLLADPDVNPANARPLTEVLSRTGSKTVFVANDAAWQQFFSHNATLPADNPWHNATSYELLSPSQKKLLIHSSMLNNAIVMENLASSQGTSTSSPVRGQYMRRYTDVMLTDTVTYLPPEQVPYTHNATEMNYWRRFRAPGSKGIYVVTDSTANMMLHFTAEHMTNHKITDEDFAIFMGTPRQTGDVHIYDALLLEKDGVAENGYVNVTQKVIAPLPNMAEVIRTNGRTNIFSHILDRFSYPYYNPAVTEAWNTLHPEAPIDSIFTKHYFSEVSPRGTTSGTNTSPGLIGPDGERFQDSDGEAGLKFDPGWNGYYMSSDLRTDMAAMFVPSDEAMFNYFKEGEAGWQLVRTFSSDPYAEVADGDYDALFRKIDDIPFSKLQRLVNVIMSLSFTDYVPSKMTAVLDDAQEELFSPEDVNNIDTCLLACNGAVYVMNKVYGPADFTSVAAPAFISKESRIMQWAIYNGEKESADVMKLNYYAYLKAMKSQFTFFLPNDSAMQRYFDPVSFTSQKKRVLALTYTGRGTWPISTRLMTYDPATATIQVPDEGETIGQDEVVNRLKDILESHTIVHDGTNPIDSEDEYYITKNGAAVKVTRGDDNAIVRVQGGYQLENERAGITGGAQGSTGITITTANTNQMQNGRTYVIADAPIIPASKSVYTILTESGLGDDNPYRDFYELTIPDDELIQACGLVPSSTKATDLKKKLEKYHIFKSGGIDNNVQFFNNYRYTVFVPTNEAIRDARAHGLQTWEEMREYYDNLPEDSLGYKMLTAADSTYFQYSIIYLNNFIRGHFLDNSIFADKSEVDATDFVTSSYNSELGVFVKVHCKRVKEGGVTTLYASDATHDDSDGHPTDATVWTAVQTDNSNIMARDLICSRNGNEVTPTNAVTMNNIIIQGSSFAVIHQINGVLNHTQLTPWTDNEGQEWLYPSYKGNEAEAKAYIRAYSIPDQMPLKPHDYE